MTSPEDLKAEILRLTREYSAQKHRAQRPAANLSNPAPFIPGETVIPYAGRVFTEDEVEAAEDHNFHNLRHRLPRCLLCPSMKVEK